MGMAHRRAGGAATLAAIALAVVAGVPRAWAAPQSLAIAGAQYSRSGSYVYLGAIRPIGGGELGHGFFILPFLGWSRYTFRQDGTEFSGNQPAASLAIGRAWSVHGFSLSLSLAGGYSNTTLSPHAPPNSFRGGQWFAEPELWARASLPGGASVTVNGGYLTGLRSYWATAYGQIPITRFVAVGPEVDFGGGTNYRNHTIALRIADQLTPRLALTLSAGATTNVPGSYHPYVSFSLSLPFR